MRKLAVVAIAVALVAVGCGRSSIPVDESLVVHVSDLPAGWLSIPTAEGPGECPVPSCNTLETFINRQPFVVKAGAGYYSGIARFTELVGEYASDVSADHAARALASEMGILLPVVNMGRPFGATSAAFEDDEFIPSVSDGIIIVAAQGKYLLVAEYAAGLNDIPAATTFTLKALSKVPSS